MFVVAGYGKGLGKLFKIAMDGAAVNGHTVLLQQRGNGGSIDLAGIARGHPEQQKIAIRSAHGKPPQSNDRRVHFVYRFSLYDKKRDLRKNSGGFLWFVNCFC